MDIYFYLGYINTSNALGSLELTKGLSTKM